jgi:hypothetical protein
MASWVGLTEGYGGEGACITSKTFLGGWLYPDAAAAGFEGAEVFFDDDAVDCAATGRDAVQATRTPTKRRLKAFRSGMKNLLFK